MNWLELNNYFTKSYPFFDKITVDVSDGNSGYTLHPVIKLSAALALKTIESPNNNKLIILLPNRLDSSIWLSVLCTLGVMQYEFNQNIAASIAFRQGQKLLVGNCVVEFIEEYDRDNTKLLCVRCSDGKYSIHQDRILHFQPADTRRPLSPMKKVVATYLNADMNGSRLDRILGIKSYDNMALFNEYLLFISKIGNSESFIRNNTINDAKIADLFMWGKIDSHGDLLKLKTEQIDAQPTCIVSSDLFGAAIYIAKNQQRNKGVIIDGSAGFVNHLQILDDVLINRNIPIVVITDLFDSTTLGHLIERGFKIWQWNNKNIIELRCVEMVPEKSPFHVLNQSLSNYCRKTIDADECSCDDLSESFLAIRALDRITSEVPQLKNPFSRMVNVILGLSRVVWIPDTQWINLLKNRVLSIREEFIEHGMWLGDDAMELMKTIVAKIFSFVGMLEKGENPKVSRLNCVLTQMPSSNICVILPGIEEAESAKHYWGTHTMPQNMTKIRFLPISDCINIQQPVVSQKAVVCGWMGHEKMFAFLHTHIFEQITMLLYPYEKNWYRSAAYLWNKQNSYAIKSKDFSAILGIPEAELHIIEHEPERPSISFENEDFDVVDFELRLNAYRYGEFTARPGDTAIKARLIIFSQNKFSFLTDKHKLLVITDIIRGFGQREIPRKAIDDLRSGDFVIFRESDRDLIHEIADIGLEKRGLGNMRHTSGLWKRALHEKFEAESKDVDILVALLKEFDCVRSIHTVESWLFDDDTIGPKSDTDLEAVAKATGSTDLSINLEKVQEAIRTVRGAHLQAAGFITKKLIAALPEILGNEHEMMDFSSGNALVLDLEEYGKVNILRVEEIGKDLMEIEINRVNRLLS